MIKYNDIFDFSYYPSDHKLYQINIIGQDGKGNDNITNFKVPGKFKEDNSSNVCKKWWCVGVNLRLKNLFLLLMKKVKFIERITKQGRVCHRILFKKIHYNMYEESLFKKK